MKFFSFTSLVQNLWMFVKDFLFSLVTNPVWEPTSKGITITLYGYFCSIESVEMAKKTYYGLLLGECCQWVPYIGRSWCYYLK